MATARPAAHAKPVADDPRVRPLLRTNDRGRGREHVLPGLVRGSDRSFCLANGGPNARIVNRSGLLRCGAPLPSRFVRDTDVVGGFIDHVGGAAVLDETRLVYPRPRGFEGSVPR